MKNTKRIIAVLLAVLMLALTIPFAASAAEKYTATINGKTDYSVTVYKVATIGADGKYTSVSTNTAVKNAVEKATGIDMNELYAACEAAPVNHFPVTALTETKFGNPATVTFATNDAGIYYARITNAPAGVTVKSTGGSVFMLSDAKDAQGVSMADVTVNIGNKITDGTPTITKSIVDGNNRVDSVSANVGETITFELKASVAGTIDEPLSAYVIKDSMAAGKFSDPQVVSVKLTDGTDVDVECDLDDPTDITIAVTEDYLDAAAYGDNTFYENDEVIVILTAKLTNAAVRGRTTGDNDTAYTNSTANYNKDSLEFENKYGTSTIPGKTVHVYTFDLPVVKQDATNSAKKLAGATFKLTPGDKTVTTDGQGKATFTGLKAGTYKVVETVAPNGYNLNSTEYTVVISIDGTITVNGSAAAQLTVGDTPVVMPQTGSNGTAIFTIIGVSLMAFAGVLLVIVRRKRTSK